MKLLSSVIAVGVVLAAATTASAIITVDYGWEDGGTILGSYGNLADPANVSVGSDPGNNNMDAPIYDPALTVAPQTGSGMLEFKEDPHDGTPQTYIAYVENLSEGDQVTASFFGWDSTESASPSLRIWGHYALNGDVSSYDGSAGGNADYTVGIDQGQWSQVAYTWTVAAGKEALVIEARPYSTPSTGEQNTTYWVDDLRVEAPDTAAVTVPIPEPTTLALLGLGGLAVALRRRK